MLNFRHADDRWTRMRSFAVTFHGGGTSGLKPPGVRDWHLLVQATRGVVRVRHADRLWILPPHRGLWLPEGTAPDLESAGETALRMLYVRKGPRGLPEDAAVVNVTPLLREAIVRVCEVGALDARRPEQARLAAVILDEVRRLESIGLQLPWPAEGRARRFAEVAMARPEAGLEELAHSSGASVRTLERLFREETALSLGRWRRRQRLLLALARLGAGEGVSRVAAETGYGSVSAFIAMFRRELGATPGRWLK